LGEELELDNEVQHGTVLTSHAAIDDFNQQVSLSTSAPEAIDEGVLEDRLIDPLEGDSGTVIGSQIIASEDEIVTLEPGRHLAPQMPAAATGRIELGTEAPGLDAQTMVGSSRDYDHEQISLQMREESALEVEVGSGGTGDESDVRMISPNDSLPDSDLKLTVEMPEVDSFGVDGDDLQALGSEESLMEDDQPAGTAGLAGAAGVAAGMGIGAGPDLAATTMFEESAESPLIEAEDEESLDLAATLDQAEHVHDSHEPPMGDVLPPPSGDIGWGLNPLTMMEEQSEMSITLEDSGLGPSLEGFRGANTRLPSHLDDDSLDMGFIPNLAPGELGPTGGRDDAEITDDDELGGSLVPLPGGSSVSSQSASGIAAMAGLGGLPGEQPSEDLTLNASPAGLDFDFNETLDMELPASSLNLGGSGGSSLSSSPNLGLGSEIDLGHEEEDFVLSGGTSDVTLHSGDSGINLGGSGLGLAEMAGSGVELDQPLDSSLSGSGPHDDEFLLAPSGDGPSHETQDSGSEVIALDQESEFDESARTMLGPEQPTLDYGMGAAMGGPMLGPDAMGVPSQVGAYPSMGMGAMPAPSMAGMMPAGPPQILVVTEPPVFGLWSVAGLLFCLLIMIFAGTSMVENVGGLWAWQEGAQITNDTFVDQMLRAITP